MSAGGFCDYHQRHLNDEGWCDDCGEPIQIQPGMLAQFIPSNPVFEGWSPDGRNFYLGKPPTTRERDERGES